jgi:hypothetical protein
MSINRTERIIMDERRDFEFPGDIVGPAIESTTTPDHLSTLTREELSAMYESACAIAAQQYAAGADTTIIDAECDRIEQALY